MLVPANVSSRSNALKTPTSATTRPLLSSKGISPLSPPARMTVKCAASPLSPAGGLSGSPSISSKPSTPAISSRAEAQVQVQPSSAVAVDNVAPKVPALRLSEATSNKTNSAASSVRPTIAQQGLLTRKVKTGIAVKQQAPSTIFQKADAVRAPPPSSFHMKHVNSNPFEGLRQSDFPNTSKRTSIPRAVSPCATPHGGRKSLGTVPTDPILQENAARIPAQSPSIHRAHGECAPVAKPPSESPMMWTGERVSERPTSGKRCNSAPATTRPPQESCPRGISVRSTKREESLKGVWIPVPQAVRAVSVRAPYAQSTPRASTPPPSVRKPSVTPYAVGTPRVAAVPAKKPQIPLPYHTTTPRGPSPSTNPSYKVRAPFHTTTPRNRTAPSHTATTNNIF